MRACHANARNKNDAPAVAEATAALSKSPPAELQDVLGNELKSHVTSPFVAVTPTVSGYR